MTAKKPDTIAFIVLLKKPPGMTIATMKACIEAVTRSNGNLGESVQVKRIAPRHRFLRWEQLLARLGAR